MQGTTVFYDWSGGMESSAMLVLDRDRIRDTGAVVRWADTGKHFPEMHASKAQIETALGLEIVTVPRRITFDEFFERGGMIRKGTNDCSRRMKRGNLSRHMRTFPKPWEVNLGFNADEDERARGFTELNERPYCHWRYPLIEHGVSRAETVEICERAGFTILTGMYRKMGRFDCFWCGNQTPKQALKVIEYYPELAAEWAAKEHEQGHSFMPLPLLSLEARDAESFPLFQCSCFGGQESVWGDE